MAPSSVIRAAVSAKSSVESRRTSSSAVRSGSGAGPAPGYCMKLPEDRRALLKTRLAEMLGKDGPINLIARAWAIKARN